MQEHIFASHIEGKNESNIKVKMFTTMKPDKAILTNKRPSNLSANHRDIFCLDS